MEIQIAFPTYSTNRTLSGFSLPLLGTLLLHRYLKGQRSLKNIFQYRARSANPVRILLYFQLGSHLVSPGVQVHDEVLGLGVPVAHLALVAVRVPRHLLRLVLVLPANAIIIKDYTGLG